MSIEKNSHSIALTISIFFHVLILSISIPKYIAHDDINSKQLEIPVQLIQIDEKEVVKKNSVRNSVTKKESVIKKKEIGKSKSKTKAYPAPVKTLQLASQNISVKGVTQNKSLEKSVLLAKKDKMTLFENKSLSLNVEEKTTQNNLLTQSLATNNVQLPSDNSKQVEEFENKATTSNVLTRVISKKKPIWPKKALNEELEGKVTVEFLINKKGEAVTANIVDSSGYKVLDNSFIYTVINFYKFAPEIKDGQVVPSKIVLYYEFNLEKIEE